MIKIDRNFDENTLKSDGDHIYYNLSIRKDKKNQGIAVFDDNRVEAILNKPDDYDISVIRFSVPSVNIPIFLWVDNKFTISLSLGNDTYSEILEWFPNTPAGGFDWYGKAVWAFSDFIRSINIAFQKCFDSYKIGHPASSQTLAPRMVYDNSLKICQIYVEPSYSSEIANNIEIWFNKALGEKFPAFATFGTLDTVNNPPVKIKRIQIIPNITNVKTINTVEYLVAEEEFSTIYLWNDFKTLLFETDMPVLSESVGNQKNITKTVLTDFEPLDQINDRSAIQYFPQGLPRFYDMVSSYPLSRVSVRVSWQTKSGVIFPIRLNDDDVLTVKLYFKKKGVLIDF
jgi:hypothetical protein